MRAVVLEGYGGPEVMQIREVPDPKAGPDEIIVDVAYTALNRADLSQRDGSYSPVQPDAEYEILGVEFSGTVAAIGSRVTRWQPGDRVCGLLGGGGYAEKVVTHEGMALPVPDNITLAEAAGVVEVFMTAYDALVHRANVQTGERVLIHAGGSGVGTAAIQLALARGATVWTTVGSAEKANGVQKLGARPIKYRKVDFETVIKEETAGEGVDVVLDLVGGDYVRRNITITAELGRIVVLGVLDGSQTNVNLDLLLSKRLTVIGTALRSRSLGEKLTLTRDMARHVMPLLASGHVRAIIDSEFALENVAAAHERMAANENFGKILLRMDAAETPG